MSVQNRKTEHANALILLLPPRPLTGFIAWRQELERARSRLGARCVTPHVGEDVWLGYYAGGRSAIEALEYELLAIAD